MLADVVLLPSALRAAGRTPDVPLRIIEDLEASALLLVDERAGLKDIVAEVTAWPPPYSLKALEALKRLDTRNRVLRLPGKTMGERPCGPGCTALHGVAKRWHPAVYVCGGSCCSQDDGVDAVPASGYSLSSVPALLRETSVELSTRTDTVMDLQDVLTRFLKRAKDLVLFDRHLGRSAAEDFVKYGDVVVPERFDISVRAILETFADCVTATGLLNPSVMVVTGVWADARPEYVADGLRDWASGLSKEFRLAITVDARLERKGPQQLAHDRFIATNIAALNVSRGLDLLLTADQWQARRGKTGHRPVHTTLLTVVPVPTEALLDAKDLPQVRSAR